MNQRELILKMVTDNGLIIEKEIFNFLADAANIKEAIKFLISRTHANKKLITLSNTTLAEIKPLYSMVDYMPGGLI